MNQRRLDISRAMDGYFDISILDNYRYNKKSGGWVWDARYVGKFKEEELIAVLMETGKLIRRPGTAIKRVAKGAKGR